MLLTIRGHDGTKTELLISKPSRRGRCEAPIPCRTTGRSMVGRSGYVPSRMSTVSAPESMAIWTVGYASGTTTELARTRSTERIPERSRAQTLQASGLDKGNLAQEGLVQ